MDGKTLFKVRQTSSLFLEGEGSLDATFNRIHVRLSQDFDQVVIRYNWTEGLKSSAPVEIFPFDMGDGVQFIGIRPKRVKDFELKFKP